MQEQYGTISGPELLAGNGDGTLNRIGEFYVGPISRGAVVADFNGDGMPEIAVLNDNNNFAVDYISFVTVMQNSTHPVSVSPLSLNYGTTQCGEPQADHYINFPLASLAHLQLARAKAMSRDHDAARKAYQDFFEVWKNADSDVPVLKEARAEYAKLEPS